MGEIKEEKSRRKKKKWIFTLSEAHHIINRGAGKGNPASPLDPPCALPWQHPCWGEILFFCSPERPTHYIVPWHTVRHNKNSSPPIYDITTIASFFIGNFIFSKLRRIISLQFATYYYTCLYGWEFILTFCTQESIQASKMHEILWSTAKYGAVSYLLSCTITLLLAEI